MGKFQPKFDNCNATDIFLVSNSRLIQHHESHLFLEQTTNQEVSENAHNVLKHGARKTSLPGIRNGISDLNNKLRRIRVICMHEKGPQKTTRTLRHPLHFKFIKDWIKVFKRHSKSRFFFSYDETTNFKSQLHRHKLNISELASYY